MNLFDYTYDLVKQIPTRKVSTYGAVARALGDIRASRAVGYMMNQNPDPDSMPCFKIVKSDGSIGGFGRGIADKIRRLKNDEVRVKNDMIVDFENVFFNSFKTDYPLKNLRKEQINESKKLIIKNNVEKIDFVAGFDVANPKDAFDDACGAFVIIDYKTKKIVEKKTVFMKNLFPYIPTYLTFRELPFVRKLMEVVDIKPDVLLIDGNGILHPFGFGLASHVGVSLGIPTVGVAKSLLCGNKSKNYIYFDGKKVGYMFFSSKKIKKPVYISPGHMIDLKKSIEIVKKLSKYKHPEPLRQAHIHATKSIKS